MRRHRVTRRFEFDAAHRLKDYDGRCCNFHGHRYVAEVTVEATGFLSSNGFVMDFCDLSKTVGQWIDENWDHALLLNDHDEIPIVGDGKAIGRVYRMRQPTAENMAAELLNVARDMIESASGLRVIRVRIYETPESWADCFDEY